MPSLVEYRNIHTAKYSGLAKKYESDSIMKETWWEDINSRYGYFYDSYHDSEPLKLKDLNPEEDEKKVQIPIKFLQNSSQTYSKDVVTFHIQFMPDQECIVDYYDEVFGSRYGASFPIGLYVDIQDERGIYNRWLVVDKANFNVTQFPTFEVLPCEKVIQFVYKEKKYQFPGVLRSQNSYNSGIWRDLYTTVVEDQYKFLLPLNRDTEKIYYNQRLILDAPVLTEPRAWKITKINRLAPYGIGLFTMAQDKYNQHTDYIEKDQNGNVIGMWADYWENNFEPTEQKQEIINEVISKIVYSGNKPQIKIGGSYKKFTAVFMQKDKEISPQNGTWAFTMDGEDISNIFSILYVDSNFNQVKIKAPNDNNYLGKTIKVSYVSSVGTTSIDVDIVAL